MFPSSPYMFTAAPSPAKLALAEFQMGRLLILPGGRVNLLVYPLLGAMLQELDSGELAASGLEARRGG